MLRYPTQVSTQQGVLAPLVSLTSQVPACELWISFLNQVNNAFTSLTSAALTNLSNMANCLANVFDYLYSSNTQSIYSSQYLLVLSINARQCGYSAALQAPIATGTLDINLTQAAQSALSTLNAWDPVLGYQTPASPAQLATTLMQGVSL